MIEISNLKIQLSHFSLSLSQFTLSQKGLYLLKGNNGSGKSTLLNILAGLNNYYHGDIFFEKKDYNQLSRIEFARKIAYLPQMSELLPKIQGQEFIEQGLYIGGNSYLDYLVNELSIQNLLTKFCNQLSGGESQLLKFTRNLAINRPIILLDEPEIYLSKSNRFLISQLINKLSNNHLILIATHHEELYNPNQILNFIEYDDCHFKIKI